jgi:Lrp/AsnC family transcriptional regulator, leucine-responsive regulatory protein
MALATNYCFGTVPDRFKRTLKSTAEVMSAFYVTGEAEFVILLTAKDMEDDEQFTRRFFYENPDIKGFKTLVVMDRNKVGFTLPVQEQ